MSKDSQYQHHMWHVEEETLTICNPKLELLLDFDPPSQFNMPSNAPLLHGVRPGGTALTPSSSSSGCRTLAAFGRVGGAGQPVEDDLVMDWRRTPTLPSMTNASS